MAAGKKTGGRQKGSRNKRTQELQQASAEAGAAIEAVIPGAFDGDAHALLIAIYKSPEFEWHARADAAKAALPFEKHRLASVQHSGPDGGPIETVELSPIEAGRRIAFALARAQRAKPTDKPKNQE